MSVRCPKCGGTAERAGGVCPACGAALPPPAKKKKKKRINRFVRSLLAVWRTLVVLLLSAAAFALALAGACLVLTRGPSEDARNLFVQSADETSALKFLPRWFLPEETVEAILHPVRGGDGAAPGFKAIGYEPAEGETEAPPLVVITEESVTDELEIIDIRKATFKGKMLIIHDPSRVVVGTLDRYGGSGMYLTEFMDKYDAIAGTNAGGFDDPGGNGSGGIPDGIVMENGAIKYGSRTSWYRNLIGFDADHILHVGSMTGQDALDLGIVNAVSFSPGPVLIQDGVKLTDLGGGVNPRTCIGQREDGAVLLAVLEGRHPDSLGATYDDLADLMEEYGAVNAANLDGGSSSAMMYDGEQITKGSNLIGSRRMATAILVLREGGGS